MRSRKKLRLVDEIDGYRVECSRSGVLTVTLPGGRAISVLPTGTHVALDSLPPRTKKRVVDWWKKVR